VWRGSYSHRNTNPSTEPHTPAPTSTPHTSGVPTELQQQYACIWDSLPAAQYTSPPQTRWYLSNPVSTIQIMSYYTLHPQLQPVPPCHYCGTARGDYPFDHCLHAIACIYCYQGHTGQTFPTLHQACTKDICLVPKNHLNAEPDQQMYSHWICPRSSIIKHHY
jgi:hypothetical protein